MLVLQQFRSAPQPCTYLPTQTASLEYLYAASLAPAEYEALMNRGYRKFGALVFRPVCAACSACRPIRVPVASFRPDASQRRARKRNQDLTVRVGPPVADERRLALFRRYHAARTATRGWPDGGKDLDDYRFSFVDSPIPSLEIAAWLGDELLAVMICDLTPRVLSAVYHYYEPSHAARSLGTFIILETMARARSLGREHVYLGYLVQGCPSMEYKARFRPCEVLDTAGHWQPVT